MWANTITLFTITPNSWLKLDKRQLIRAFDSFVAFRNISFGKNPKLEVSTAAIESG